MGRRADQVETFWMQVGWIQVFRRIHRRDLGSTGLLCRRWEQQTYKDDHEHDMFAVQLAISYFQAGGDSFIVEVDDAEFEMVLSLLWLIPLSSLASLLIL